MEKSIKVRTQANYKPRIKDMEKTTGVSVTIPGQSYSVKELIQRHLAGNMPAIVRQEYYEEDPSLDNIDPTQDPAFDLSDATMLKEATAKRIELQKAVKAEADKEAAEEKKLKADIKVKEDEKKDEKIEDKVKDDK